MAGRVQYDASFTSDTSQAEQNVKRYADQIKAANAVLDQQARIAKQSYQEQRTQALATGASTEQLNKLTMDYNRSLFAIGNTAKQLGQTLADVNRGAIYSEDAKAQAIAITNKELQSQIVIVNELAVANAHQSHESVSGVQATSAAIRGLEGSGGIRAIENFLSKTLGLGPAMQAIFPLVGGLMFGKMLLDTGEKIYEVEQKAAHAAETIRTTSEQWHEKAQVNIDDLAIQADKLQLNIDKLSGHPGNGLQLSLDEARKYADQLLNALAADNKELQELFKTNNVGFFAGALQGIAGTGNQEKQLLADRTGLTNKFRDINRQFNAELANAKSTDEVKAAGDRRDAAMRNATQKTIDTYRSESKRLREEYAKSPDVQLAQTLGKQGLRHRDPGADRNSAKEANFDADSSQLSDLLATQAAQKRVTDLTAKDEAARQAKELAEANKRGNSEALSAARKAAEEQRKQWEVQDAEAAQQGKLTADQTLAIWIGRENATKVGSENYILAERKAFEALKQVNEQTAKQLDEKLKMERQFAEADQKRYSGVLEKATGSDAKGITDQQQSLKALLDSQRENTYQQALAQVQQQAALGTISKYDQAVQLQTLHTAEYTAQLKELQAQRDAITGQDSESVAKRNTLDKQIGDLSTRSSIDAMKDSAAVASETWYSALHNANARWIQDSQDSAKQITELYSSIMQGVNGNLVDAMTGSKTQWKSTFQGIAKQTAGMGLQRAESSLMGALGLGKADGSRGNPLWVRMADGSLAGTAGKVAGSMGGGFGGFIQGVFGGFRANGGGMDAGKTYVTGERGPELITMGSNGYATSNRDMQSMLGGGGHTFQISVDASNSHDPAATEMAVRRGIAAATPGIMAATARSIQADRSRTRTGSAR